MKQKRNLAGDSPQTCMSDFVILLLRYISIMFKIILCEIDMKQLLSSKENPYSNNFMA